MERAFARVVNMACAKEMPPRLHFGRRGGSKEGREVANAAVQVRRKVETIVTKRLNRAARSPNQVAAASPFLAERVPQ